MIEVSFWVFPGRAAQYKVPGYTAVGVKASFRVTELDETFDAIWVIEGARS